MLDSLLPRRKTTREFQEADLELLVGKVLGRSMVGKRLQCVLCSENPLLRQLKIYYHHV